MLPFCASRAPSISIVLAAYGATCTLFCAIRPITSEPFLAAYVRLPIMVIFVLVDEFAGSTPLMISIRPGQPVPCTQTLSATYKMPLLGADNVVIGLTVVVVIPLEFSLFTMYSLILPLLSSCR